MAIWLYAYSNDVCKSTRYMKIFIHRNPIAMTQQQTNTHLQCVLQFNSVRFIFLWNVTVLSQKVSQYQVSSLNRIKNRH